MPYKDLQFRHEEVNKPIKRASTQIPTIREPFDVLDLMPQINLISLRGHVKNYFFAIMLTRSLNLICTTHLDL